ncbi:MAG: hypothetical protein ACLPXB_07305 [Thiobacillaceae bacterium]
MIYADTLWEEIDDSYTVENATKTGALSNRDTSQTPRAALASLTPFLTF